MIRDASAHALVHLALTSTVISVLAERVLYASIHVEACKKTEGALRTLSANLTKARYVQILTVQLSGRLLHDTHANAVFADLLSSALWNTTTLVKLRLYQVLNRDKVFEVLNQSLL